MATITVRKILPSGEPSFGNGQADFISDLDAVAQIIGTKLKFLLGEWWEDLSQGFPLFQSLIGSSGSITNQQASTLIIQDTILSAPYTLEVLQFTWTFNSANRASSFTAITETQFGTLTVTNAPGSSAAVQ